MRVVFVHGAFVRDGSWWWAPVAGLLERDGFASGAVALPSCGEGTAAVTGDGPGLLQDAAALTALLDDSAEPTVVVASSYGGMVVAQGAGRPNVRHLVYLSSVLPEIGDRHAALAPPGPDPLPVGAAPDGSLFVVDDDPAAFDRRFLQDVADPALVAGAHERLTAQSPAAFTTASTSAAWHDIPSTYLVCTEDHNTSAQLQREHAARATRSIDLATGHHPFLSRPDLVAGHIRQIAAQT